MGPKVSETDTMPPPIDPSLCGPGTVPGWLNEDGLPTSCVGDLPMVEIPEDVVFEAEPAPFTPPVFEAEPAPVEPAPVEPAPIIEPEFTLPDTSTGEVATWNGDELASTGPFEDVLLGFFVGFALVGIGILVYANHIKRSWRKGDKR